MLAEALYLLRILESFHVGTSCFSMTFYRKNTALDHTNTWDRDQHQPQPGLIMQQVWVGVARATIILSGAWISSGSLTVLCLFSPKTDDMKLLLTFHMKQSNMKQCLNHLLKG